MRIEVVLHPAEIALLWQTPDALRGAACVVFDVLRATTSIVTAFADGGARAVFPAATVEEARALKAGPLAAALLCGERDGLALPGFDLGNSPREYADHARLAGRDVISTTTNGTVALRTCVRAGAPEVFVGSLRNLHALAGHLCALSPERLCLVCAGTVRTFALEDAFGAGALLAEMTKIDASNVGELSDAARAVRAVFARYRGHALAAFRDAANGRRLVEIGLGDDLSWCAQNSVSSVLPALSGDGLASGAIRPL